MSQNLWTAFIASDGSNQILVDSSPDGKNWTGSRFINQWSPFTPALAYFGNNLYLAFITNDVDSATGVPSNRIFVCSSPDGVSWTPAVFFNQYSKCAPALAVFGDALYLAFVANNSTNQILYCTFTEQAGWSGDFQTGQASPLSPSLVQYGESLQMVFVSNDNRNAILRCDLPAGGSWGGSTDTGQSTKFAPAVAGFNNDLYVAFVADNDTNSLLLTSAADWSTHVSINQSTRNAPNLAVFNNGQDSLFVGFAGNNSAHCLLSSSSNPSSWPSSNTDIQQSTNSGIALAIAPFACCAAMVTPSNEFGGPHNYFIWAGPCPNPPSLTSLKLTVSISSDVFSTNGWSIQWNCWSPLGSNINCAWQQYGFTIDQLGNIDYYLENWPTPSYKTVDGQTLAGNIVDYRTNHTADNFNFHWYTLPTPSLPAGYTLIMELVYVQNSAQVAGIQCTVVNQDNQVVADSGIVDLTSLHIDTKATNPVNVPTDALTPVVGFQLAVVGIVNLADAQFVSGQGTLVVSSPNSPIIAIPKRPDCITPFPGTGENSTCVYSQLPDAPSVLMVQTFTV